MTDMYLLKNKLYKVLDFIDNKNDVVFLDYPLYHNIGDLLILLGTMRFFKNNAINVRSYLSVHNTDISRLKKIVNSDTTIICQGGGNFGDVYPVHQNLRENVIKSFPKNRVIILPQTAYFSSMEKKEKSKSIFTKHTNVIMFARDKTTYSLFKEFSDQAYLLPDMAHELYGTLPKSEKQKSTLYFLRSDIEKKPVQLELQEKIKGYECVDWIDLLTKKDHRVVYTVQKMIQLNKKLKSNKLDNAIFRIWRVHSENLVSRMSKKFSSYEKIITSRLHGHILSCLVDVPSSIIDNSYGKNTSYYALWTKNLEITSVWSE